MVAVVSASAFDRLKPGPRYTVPCKVVPIVHLNCTDNALPIFSYLRIKYHTEHTQHGLVCTRKLFSGVGRLEAIVLRYCSSLTDVSSVCNYRRCTPRGLDSCNMVYWYKYITVYLHNGSICWISIMYSKIEILVSRLILYSWNTYATSKFSGDNLT